MNFDDDYLLAREYAESMFDGSDERFWVAVGAYIKGFEAGTKGLKKVVEGDRITRVVFFFSAVPRSFELKHPIMVANRFTFLHQLRHITGIREVGIYDDKNH